VVLPNFGLQTGYVPVDHCLSITKKCKTEKLKKVNMDMLRSNSKQTGEYMESVVKKKRKAAAGRICRKGRF